MKLHRRNIAVVAAVLAAVAIVLLGGCGGTGSSPAASVSGTLLDDQTLQAIAGGQVRVGTTLSAATGANGMFVVSPAPIGSGQNMEVSAPGHDAQTFTINVAAGGNPQGTIYVPPTAPSGTGNIQGVVTLSGVHQAGLSVTAAGVTGKTKSDGSFSLYGVTPGVSIIVSASDGTNSGQISVRVTAGQTTTGVQLALSLVPPAPPS